MWNYSVISANSNIHAFSENDCLKWQGVVKVMHRTMFLASKVTPYWYYWFGGKKKKRGEMFHSAVPTWSSLTNFVVQFVSGSPTHHVWPCLDPPGHPHTVVHIATSLSVTPVFLLFFSFCLVMNIPRYWSSSSSSTCMLYVLVNFRSSCQLTTLTVQYKEFD